MNNESFETKDLQIASLLYAVGTPFVRVHRDRGVCWFIFENKADCDRLQRQYYARSAPIDALTFADAMRTLKDMIFSTK